MLDKAGRIAALNDELRRAPRRWALSAGLNAILCADEGTRPGLTEQLIRAIVSFADFSPSNDPYGERDLGCFEFQGESCLWKIDYFHPERSELSPAPWDRDLCRRVLTVMLAEER